MGMEVDEITVRIQVFGVKVPLVIEVSLKLKQKNLFFCLVWLAVSLNSNAVYVSAAFDRRQN